MVLSKQEFIELSNGSNQIGIRIELINRESGRIINFEEAKRLLPFLQSAGIKFLELGSLSAFDRGTGKEVSIFAKDPGLISPQYFKTVFGIEESGLENNDLKALKGELYEIILNKKYLSLPKLVDFERSNAYWLKDYACFMALSDYIGNNAFSEWPEDIKTHDRKAIGVINKQLSNQIFVEEVLQFLVERSQREFVEDAHKHGIYVSNDVNLICEERSSEVWSHSKLFYLNKEFKASVYIGLPPSGALRNGIKYTYIPYRWNELYGDSFEFFRKLFEHYEEGSDYGNVLNGHTIFHYWEVSPIEEDLKYGRWVPVKFDLFYEYTKEHFSKFSYIFDYNEPLFPGQEVMVKRHGLLQSRILGEISEHRCANYDLSRRVHMIRSKLCDTKLKISDKRREWILKEVKGELSDILGEKIPIKIMHMDEVYALLKCGREEVMSKSEYYGNKFKDLINGINSSVQDPLKKSLKVNKNFKNSEKTKKSGLLSRIKRYFF